MIEYSLIPCNFGKFPDIDEPIVNKWKFLFFKLHLAQDSVYIQISLTWLFTVKRTRDKACGEAITILNHAYLTRYTTTSLAV
jgi:hypothetical protein